jgi:hypothetical protein
MAAARLKRPSTGHSCAQQRRLPLTLPFLPPPPPPPPPAFRLNAPSPPRAPALATPSRPPTWPPRPARCAVPPSPGPAQQPRRFEARSRRDPAALLPRRFLRGKARSRSQQPGEAGARCKAPAGRGARCPAKIKRLKANKTPCNYAKWAGFLGPVSAKTHPAPGVALAVLLTTFPAF